MSLPHRSLPLLVAAALIALMGCEPFPAPPSVDPPNSGSGGGGSSGGSPGSDAPDGSPGDASDSDDGGDRDRDDDDGPTPPSQPPADEPAPPTVCELDDAFDSVRDFNAVVFGDWTAGHSDVEGRLAAWHIDVWNYSIGLKDPDGLVAIGANSVKMHSGTFHGDVGYGYSFDLTNGTMTHSDGSAGQAVEATGLFDFNGAWLDMQLVSEALAEHPATGLTTFMWGGLFLESDATDLAVFHVPASQLSVANQMEIDVEPGATVVVNVVGTGTVQFSNFAIFGDTPPSHVLFNAPQVDLVRIEAFGFIGSLLAPYADVDFDNGQFDGTLVAHDFVGDGLADGQPDGQLDLALFAGSLCPAD